MQPDLSVRKVLIYRLGSFGDTVVALPCLHLIARSFPNAERRMLTNFPVHAKAPASAAIIGDSGLVHSYMRYDYGTRSPRELWRLIREIRAYKPDVLIYLIQRKPKGVQRDHFFFKLAGVKRIIGIPENHEFIRGYDAATGMHEHESVRLARTLSALGDAKPSDLANWSLHLTEAERQRAVEVLAPVAGRPLIICAPGTKMQAKEWDREKWQSLLARLYANYPGYGLAMVGAAEDGEVSGFSAAGWSGPKVDLCGKLTPRETGAVFEHAAGSNSVFLGLDSGPMHMAYAVGLRCVIAFSARGFPGAWYPVGPGHEVIFHKVSCAGCYLETCITEKRRCMTSITVEEILAAVTRVLGNTLQVVR